MTEPFRTAPTSPATLESLAALFDAAGSACFCRYHHFDGDKNQWLERLAFAPDENRAELAACTLAGKDEAGGVVAFAGTTDQVIGYAKLSWATTVKKIYEQRYYRGLPVLQRDPTGVLTLGCFLVHPTFRRRGVTSALLAQAKIEAARRGARCIEALPRVAHEPLADEELWMGIVKSLDEAGFEAVMSEPPYPVYRLTLPTP
jgi:GNAT superfamily N-acetyltransferase